jgi:hypothetical protein
MPQFASVHCIRELCGTLKGVFGSQMSKPVFLETLENRTRIYSAVKMTKRRAFWRLQLQLTRSRTFARGLPEAAEVRPSYKAAVSTPRPPDPFSRASTLCRDLHSPPNVPEGLRSRPRGFSLRCWPRRWQQPAPPRRVRGLWQAHRPAKYDPHPAHPSPRGGPATFGPGPAPACLVAETTRGGRCLPRLQCRTCVEFVLHSLLRGIEFVLPSPLQPARRCLR